jgi:hypothetical protein
MRTLKFIMLGLVVTAFFTSCQKIKGKGDLVTETRTVSGYNSVSLSMDASVYVTNGTEYTLEVMAQENLLPYIQTKLEHDRLVIKIKNTVSLGHHEPIKILITAPGMTDLDVSGSGLIDVQNDWLGTTLETHISGSGKISLSHVQCGTLKAKISGSGDIEAESGQVSAEDLNISGSGNIEFRYVVASDVNADISGSGNIYTQATTLLDATISGSGNIYYLGNPQINAHISGSGNIMKIL